MPTVELSGGRIHYETAGPADGRRVVCIHGYLMASSLWRPLSDLLAARGLVLASCDAFEHFPPPILKPLITAARLGAPAFAAALAALRTRVGRSRAYGALAHCDLDELAREWLSSPLSNRGVRHDLRRFTASLATETTPRAPGQADRRVLLRDTALISATTVRAAGGRGSR